VKKLGRPLVAFLAGAAMVLAFAPFEVLPVALLALATLAHLWITARSPRAAAWTGFLFGMGMFLAGVSWVFVSLHRFGAMPAPLAGVATVGFCVILSAYPAMAGYVQAKLRAGPAVRATISSASDSGVAPSCRRARFCRNVTAITITSKLATKN
jgi:apolipoprotein N-acyltransferase